jgi:Ca-activated chloride channel family protein
MFRLIASITLLASLLMFESAPAVHAQGLLLLSEPDRHHPLPRPMRRPVPGQPGFLYDIAKLEIDASIRDQVAEVQVAQTFKNRTSQTLQVKFVFPLPYDGAIDQMTFMVDGQELEGRLLEADKAREIYQSYVRRSQDPALVQWIGTGMFQTQVFPVPPGAERTVSLRYTQLCKRSGSLNDWLLPLSPTQFTSSPIGHIVIRGRIRSDSQLGNVYSPSHDIEIDRSSDRVVRFEYSAKSKVPNRDFRVIWDSGDRPVQLSVVSHRADPDQDGYFMLMIQPQFPEPSKNQNKAGKNLVLVMDKSGSMRGEKIDQTRRAARYVINRLKSRDRFTLINYDSNVETFRSELTSADKETRLDAEEYVDSMLAGGSTNIDDALSAAFQIAKDADGPVYVVFMTDGQPTVGERNLMKIADNAKRDLSSGTRLFSLGVGHDVNSRLLDKLASICLGQTMYVRPGEALDGVVSNLYDRIGAPALTDARLKITVGGKEGRIRQLYPADMYDLFSGDQLVIVGRYRRHGGMKIQLTGDFLGQRKEYVFEDELPKQTGSGENVFVERLWATRRIGQIIDEIDLHGENKELVDELIVLSKRHGILTPYTAYLAEERTDLNDLSRGRRIARAELESLQEEVGADAFYQRDFKSSLRSAGRAPTPNAASQSLDGALKLSASGNSARTSRGAISGGARFGLGSQSAPRPASKERALGELDDAIVQRVKQIGAKTFFRRANRYVDSDATDKQIAEAIKIEQFSDQYFDLLAELDEESRIYLAEASEVLVVLKGKTYLIVPPKPEPSKK